MLQTTPLALSFDIEDWFTVRNMRELIREDQWDQLDYRVHIGVDYLLEQCEKHKIKATFFILGWIAERSPDLIKKIHHQGHEIASHGYSHTPIDLLTPESFEEDLQKSLEILERITGEKILGYRAPSFSITKKTSWAIDILKKYGLKYDSSVFITQHPDYGISDFPKEITELGEDFVEIPMQKSSVYGVQLPVCGGGYFRMFPYHFIKKGLISSQKKGPTVLYFHPWEFDPKHPRMPLSALKKFRHYIGLNGNRKKFERLLSDFKFCPMKDLISGTSLSGPSNRPKYSL